MYRIHVRSIFPVASIVFSRLSMLHIGIFRMSPMGSLVLQAVVLEMSCQKSFSVNCVAEIHSAKILVLKHKVAYW